MTVETDRHTLRATTSSQLMLQVAHHHALRAAIETILPDLVRRQTIDPLNALILNQLPTLAIPVYLLLAWTHCRWSELSSIDLTDLFTGRPLKITSSKHGKDRHIPALLNVSPNHWANLDPFAPLCIVSYDVLRQLIRLAHARARIPHIPGAMTDTHLPRHLWASWSISRGASIRQVADGLGHHQTSSTLSYIHAEIVGFCRQNRL